MARVAIVVGGLLFGLGLGSYYASDQNRWFSIICSIPGVALFGLGLAALKDSFRRHALHAACVVALLGFVLTVFGLVELVRTVLAQPQHLMQSAMAVLCAVFVGLSVKSFLAARFGRKSPPRP